MTESKTKSMFELFADACIVVAEGIRSANPSATSFIPKLTQDETAAKIIRIASRVFPTAPIDRGPIAAAEYIAECAVALVERVQNRDYEIATLRGEAETLRWQLAGKIESANATVGKLVADQADEIASLREQLAAEIEAREQLELSRAPASAGDAVVLAKLDEIACHLGGETATSTERVLAALQHVLDVEYAIENGSVPLLELHDDSLGYAIALDKEAERNAAVEARMELRQALANLTYTTRAYTTAAGALAQLGAQTSGLAMMLTRDLKLPHPRGVAPSAAPLATPSEETKS